MIFSQEKEFWKFRQDHPQLRFFEALKQFIEADKIMVEKDGREQNTEYWSDLGIIEK